MRYCEAHNCRNSSRSGSKMCHFPKSPTRRNKWIENVGRAGWIPNKYSTLCEAHFSEEMWENVITSEKKKLKRTAIPNIFHRPPIVMLMNVIEKPFTQTVLKVNTSINTQQNSSCDNPQPSSTDLSISEHFYSKQRVHEMTESARSIRPGIELPVNLKEDSRALEQQCHKGCVEKVQQLERLLRRSERVIKTMKTQHKRQRQALEKRLRELQKEVTSSRAQIASGADEIMDKNISDVK